MPTKSVEPDQASYSCDIYARGYRTMDHWFTTKAALQKLELTHLKAEEESVSPTAWVEIANHIYNYFTALKTRLQSISSLDEGNACVPPVELLILLAGTIANQSTSNKLRLPDIDLQKVASDLLTMIVSRTRLSCVRDLLLLPPSSPKSPISNSLAQQLLNICVLQLARAPKSQFDQLSFRPIYRDALIWLTSNLDYPELAGEDFIGVLQPLGLQLIADYRQALQLSGFSLLQQLTVKARIADWRRSNRAEAVISELFQLRIGSTPGSAEQLLQQCYATLFSLVNLLEPKKVNEWNDKLADRILFDLCMETRKSRQCVLIQHLEALISTMRTQFVEHTRRFCNAFSSVLLGPRTPTYLRKSLQPEALDSTVNLKMLHCLHTLLRLSWPFVSPSLLPSVIPPLVAFVDLEQHYRQKEEEGGRDSPDSSSVFQQLKDIFDLLLQLEPRLVDQLFRPASDIVPAMQAFLPVSQPESLDSS